MFKKLFSALVVLAIGATTLPAQTPELQPEIRSFAGAMVATGSQRSLFNDAPLFGVQTALEVRQNLHLLVTFGWMPAQSKYSVLDNDVNILEYDAGVEFGFAKPLAGKWQIKPFMGVGTGGRTYLYGNAGLRNRSSVTMYGAVGTEFQVGHTALRLEARDIVFPYRSPFEGVATRTRNEIGLVFGLAYHIR